MQPDADCVALQVAKPDCHSLDDGFTVAVPDAVSLGGINAERDANSKPDEEPNVDALDYDNGFSDADPLGIGHSKRFGHQERHEDSK